jgi:hypothetical protein
MPNSRRLSPGLANGFWTSGRGASNSAASRVIVCWRGSRARRRPCPTAQALILPPRQVRPLRHPWPGIKQPSRVCPPPAGHLVRRRARPSTIFAGRQKLRPGVAVLEASERRLSGGRPGSERMRNLPGGEQRGLGTTFCRPAKNPDQARSAWRRAKGAVAEAALHQAVRGAASLARRLTATRPPRVRLTDASTANLPKVITAVLEGVHEPGGPACGEARTKTMAGPGGPRRMAGRPGRDRTG